MIKYTLLFETISDLWEFEENVHPQFVIINFPNKTISCHCSDSDIVLALEKYHAKVIEFEYLPVFEE